LSVKYQNFIAVFLGSLVALSLATLLGVLVAGRLHRFIPKRYITPASGILFILLGIITLVMA
jgi:putative Ca2+/H+ antiporter (TMEM165/GDT1 family)